MQTITPFLWFDHQAEEAVNFYVSLFEHAEILNVERYGEGGPREPGTVMTMSFRLAGQDFIALNGGPEYQFSEATSFFVNCETQAEVDRLWDELAKGGEVMDCGWVKDRYGVTWQIVPTILGQLLQDPDPQKAGRVVQAMLKMKKLDIQALQAAYEQS
ncbi:MAG: VOC family protein [Anaerolineaceae bacterium]|nr:VOC family protein [Anaerolineaceae bacterium]